MQLQAKKYAKKIALPKNYLILYQKVNRQHCAAALQVSTPQIRSLMQFNADLNERLKFLINPF